MSTMGERIRMIRKSQPGKMTQTEFAASLGKRREAYSMYEIDRVTPSPEMQHMICDKYGIDPHWLKTGAGAMRLPADEDEEMIDAALKDGDPLIRHLLYSIVKDPQGWRAFADEVKKVYDFMNVRGFYGEDGEGAEDENGDKKKADA